MLKKFCALPYSIVCQWNKEMRSQYIHTAVEKKHIGLNTFGVQILDTSRRVVDKSTQLHGAFIGHARQRDDCTSHWLAAVKLGRLVLG